MNKAMCPSCEDLNIEFQIKVPSDLRQAIAVTRDNLADGTISNVSAGGDCKPFNELVSSGKWMMSCYITFGAILAVNYLNSLPKRIMVWEAGGSRLMNR